jgi:hypothetical protein
MHADVHQLPPPDARASAFMALSTRARGAHVAPSGVTANLSSPRFRKVIEMWTVIVRRSRRRPRHAAALLLPTTCCTRRSPFGRSRTSPQSPARRPDRPAAARHVPARSCSAQPHGSDEAVRFLASLDHRKMPYLKL